MPVGQDVGATTVSDMQSLASSASREDSESRVAAHRNSAQYGGSLVASPSTQRSGIHSDVNSVSPVPPTQRTGPPDASLVAETKPLTFHDHAQSGISGVAAREADMLSNQTANLCNSDNGVDSVDGVPATSTIKKPSIAIPRMTRLDSDAPSSKQSSPLNPSAISRRSSKYGSGLDSRKSSRRQSKALSSHSSVTSLRSHRPAPPSPASSHPSRRQSQSTLRSHSRHESNDSQSSSNPTERFPSHKPSTSSMRKSFSSTGASGSINVDGSGTQSTLVITFNHTQVDAAQKSQVDGKPPPPVAPKTSQESSTQAGIQKTGQNAQKLAPLSASHSHIRRNFSSTSASTSGSSSSVPSNPAARHANELAAAYASMGIYLPMAGTPTEICDEHEAVTNEPPAADEDNLQWHRDHPIVVRDFAFDESDERFSKQPIELMMRCDRPLLHHSRSYEWRRNQPRFAAGGGGGYSSGVHYGDPWGGEYEEEEDEDDWGFPLGSISGGTSTAPMGSTHGGGPRSELKNRSRAWANLGSKSLGGKWVNVSEEESSNYYEESGEEDGFEEISPQPQFDDDFNEDDVHTPSTTFKHSPLHDVHPHPEVDGQDGVDGDDDFSSGDELGYDDVNPEPLKTGVYRALYPFEAEGPSEMSVEVNQLVRIIGRGGGEGWVVALRNWTPEQEIKGTRNACDTAVAQGLVPEGYLQPYQLDEQSDEM